MLDFPADDFDVDEHVYQIQQEFDEKAYNSEEKSKFVRKKKVVAEGDSWMNLPWFMDWRAIGDSLKYRNKYKVRNIGKWGHTINQMVKRKQYMDVIDDKEPDYYIFSGGGNDLQDKLKAGGIVKGFDPELSVDEYLTQDGTEAISEIEEQYREMLTEVTSTFPNVKIFTHSYDNPRPLLKKGKFLGKYLRERKIPDTLMSPILNYIMGCLDTSINNVVSEFSTSVFHVNCIGATEAFLWRNDFHPKNKGFDKLAELFEKSMADVDSST